MGGNKTNIFLIIVSIAVLLALIFARREILKMMQDSTPATQSSVESAGALEP